MADAFQFNAFQASAFQTLVVPLPAFQVGAFQWNGFQTLSLAPAYDPDARWLVRIAAIRRAVTGRIVRHLTIEQRDGNRKGDVW